MSHDVLMIEDENNIRTTRFDLENEFGCKITVAATALDARNELTARNYDLVLVDVQIPACKDGEILDFGGLEVIESLQSGDLGELNQDVSYLILTAQHNSLRRESAVSHNKCLGIFRKINQSDAIVKIGEYLAGKTNTGRQ